jgi:hypothetical protein
MSLLAGAARHIRPAGPSAAAQYEPQDIKAHGERSDIAELLQASAAAHIRCFKMTRDARGS